MLSVAGNFWPALMLLGLSIPAPARFLHQAAKAKSEDFVFEAQPKVIAEGETAVLRWSIKGAAKVRIEEASGSERDLRLLGDFGASGSLRVTPKANTTYVLSCEGSTTYSCASVTVRVKIKAR